MRLRTVLAFGIALLTFGAGSPIQALASDPSLIGQAKWVDDGFPGPAFVDEGGMPTGPDSDGPSGRSGSVQINDPALDHIVQCSGTRPYEFSIQSETSMAVFGRNVVVGYNSSADQALAACPNVFSHRHLSGYSVSHDGGKTWKSGFVPPSPGSSFTAGDPAVAVDRAGNFYYAGIGILPSGHADITVNKSTNGGETFGPAAVVRVDDGADKEWIAVGPDPTRGGQDSVYVTYTSFGAAGSEVIFAKSTDGGTTWGSKSIFKPTDNGVMSSFIQFTNPVVDASSGRLYIPFLHFSNGDADMVRVLVSNNGGGTFSFLHFNVPGAPDADAFPNVTPGVVADCGQGNGGVRNVLHSGPNVGGGRFGLPRYVHATRLITQPSAAAGDGRFLFAINSSTSPLFGDPNGRSQIRLVYSPNGGGSWKVSTVVPATNTDPQHVHPALSADRELGKFTLGYYVQQANEQLRVDAIAGQADEDGVSIDEGQGRHLSPAFDLIPSNIPFPIAGNPFFTTNYDRTIRACYNIGEYMSTSTGHGRALAAWGDNRNSWTSPANSPAAGTHSQPDAFFARIRGGDGGDGGGDNNGGD